MCAEWQLQYKPAPSEDSDDKQAQGSSALASTHATSKMPGHCSAQALAEVSYNLVPHCELYLGGSGPCLAGTIDEMVAHHY